MPKQLFFEGMEIEEKPIRTLYKPSDPELNEIEERLGQYTKAYLQKIAGHFLDLMKKFRFRYQYADGTLKEFEAIEKFENSKVHTKIEWQQVLAIFFHERNYTIVFENMSKAEKDLCREVLRKHFLPREEVNKIMGKECFEGDKLDLYWFSIAESLKKPLDRYYATTSGYYALYSIKPHNVTTYIYIDTLRQNILLKAIFSDLINIKKLDSLPEGNGLKHYCNENTIFEKLPLLDSLYNTGLLPNSISKLTATVVKKAQKMLAFPDFFDTYPEKKQASLSASLMLNFYTFFRANYGQNKIQKKAESVIRSIFDKGFCYNVFTLPVLLPYLRGIKKSRLIPDNFIYVINVIKSVLKIHYDKNWLPINSLIMNIRTYAFSAEEKFLLIDPYDIDDMYISNSYDSDTCIEYSNIIEQLSEPFVKAMLFVLATFGIVEIAYREPQKGDKSYYDGLQYVRLTELGKYVLGIRKDYTPNVTNDKGPAFELDDQRLLIKVADSKSPFIPMLKEFAVLVTPSLYRVDYDIFLTGCNKREDVKRKIDLFEQYICQKLPIIWKQFFDDILSRCAPFSSPLDEYILLCLPADNTALARLILTEPSLRRYVHKVEGYMLLVKSSEIKKFSDAMKRFGYLI